MLETGYQDGATNMAVDEAILIQQSKGLVPPTLRFYGWHPAAFSLGYFQQTERAIDLERCRQYGVEWVRRLTGGRAILHEREVTYSVVAGQEDPKVSGTVILSYLKISQGILAGLKLLGVNARLAQRGGRKRPGSAACFDAPSWYEIVVEGKKLVGSAQTRKYGSILQHGSILIELNTTKLFSLLVYPNEEIRERKRRDFAEKACSLAEVMGREPTYGEVVEAITRGFDQGLGIRIEKGELTPGELKLSQQLRLEKYTQEKWNLGERPKRLFRPFKR